MASRPFAIPTDGSYTLRDAKVPRALLDIEDALHFPANADGLNLVNIDVEDGRIASVFPAGWVSEDQVVDLGGRQVWPCFADLHAHLDKGFIAQRAIGPDGTGCGAFKTVAADRAVHWSTSDVERRFEFGLRCAYARGTSIIRTHIDSVAPQAQVSWAVFHRLQQAWSGRIALQGVSMAGLDVYLSDAGEALADLVQRSGGSALGGATRPGVPGLQDMSIVDSGLDRIFALAAARGLDVDLHVDETGDPAAATLERVAAAVLRGRFKGQVVCGHCCSLSVQSEEVATHTIALCREAGLAVVSLPMANLYLQGRRPGRTPTWRGITLVHELRAAGVPVAFASDNCHDPFFAFGDLDMLEVFKEAVRIAHLDMPYGDWPASVTSTPARLMRQPSHGTIRVGAPADLVIFEGRSMSELLSRSEDRRVVLRSGARIDATAPDHSELDDLFGAKAAAI
ncbi:cytosine deaminase [soil metagenome]